MLIPHKHFIINRQIRQFLIIVVGLFFGGFTIAKAQLPQMDDIPVDGKTQLEIIDSVSAALNEVYIFADVAKKMEKHIRNQYKKNAYKDLTTMQMFTEQLTKDLVSISHDRHLSVRTGTPEMLARICSEDPTNDEIQQMHKEQAYRNYGFEKIERMMGNVGYLKFNNFINTEYAGQTAIAAMNFLANCDAIIFDLRDNGGGSPTMIQLISSYLFKEPVHLNSFYIRYEDTTEQYWTQQYVDGPKILDADVYILTSQYTFSAAEEFTYNLKNLKRATIVGETTGGGAHPVIYRCFNELNCGIKLPYGRAINPITGTNWEGTGVEPDISVPRDQALDKAYLEALKKIKENTTDERILFSLNWTIDGLDAKAKQVEIPPETMQRYAGTYGPRKLTLENGYLYYQREQNPKMKMIPMSNNTFWFKDVDYFRLKIETDKDGNPVAVIGLYDNGHTDRSDKTVE